MIRTMIVDGNNMAHRARYSYDLSYHGVDTSVTYGVMSMLLSLIKKHKPHSLVMCWDGGTPGYRRKLVPSYKANRDHGDEDSYQVFISQLMELQEVLPKFGVLSLHRRGIEADDLMYHTSRMLEADDIVIVTSDGDLLQAVSEQVSVLCPSKATALLVSLENFVDVTGVGTQDFLRFKVLQGDSSDNIAGIHGVGPKTAANIIAGKRVGESVKARYEAFLQVSYDASLACVDLQYDRCGAREVVLDTDYTRYDGTLARHWCIDKGFVSLITEPLGTTFGNLRPPLIEPSVDMKIPVIWDYYRGMPDD